MNKHKIISTGLLLWFLLISGLTGWNTYTQFQQSDLPEKLESTTLAVDTLKSTDNLLINALNQNSLERQWALRTLATVDSVALNAVRTQIMTEIQKNNTSNEK